MVTGCHLALHKERQGYHWIPSLIEIEVDVVPGCWDEVSALICPLRSLTPDWRVLKEGSWKNGHMDQLEKRDFEEVKRILVRDWAALTGCLPSRMHQIQPDGTSIEPTRQCTITSNLRDRKLRRCRQHRCLKVSSGRFEERQDERQPGYDPLTTTTNALEVPHIAFRGRRRRRARRVRELAIPEESSSRVAQSHEKAFNICGSSLKISRTPVAIPRAMMSILTTSQAISRR